MELPQDFIDRTQPLLADQWSEFVTALSSDAPTSIRINRTKYNPVPNLDLERVAWCDTGYYLPSRPQFTFDPLFHAGTFYVQEASSMFLEQAIRQIVHSDIRVLDLCASPGGKTTLLASLLSSDSLLVSNEIIRSRAYVLSENTLKWGNPNQVVTNNKPADYTSLKHYFDLMLIDAPCSGEGMFRKDTQAVDAWSVDNVRVCAERQKDILSSVWNALKPGGYLLYSTCTYNREENEDVVAWLLEEYDASVVELDINEEWKISESKVGGKSTYHFYPHKTKGEGFFFALLQKGEEELDTRIFKPKKNKGRKPEDTISNEYKKFIVDSDNFTLFENQGTIHAFCKERYPDLQILHEHLSIISQGICLGQVKGKDFIPYQALALSNSLNKSAFVTCNVDWATAIAYLRTEAITLADCEKGYVLLTYKNVPLGFVKNLGTRANNLYPNEWRIRSTNIPSDIVSVL